MTTDANIDSTEAQSLTTKSDLMNAHNQEPNGMIDCAHNQKRFLGSSQELTTMVLTTSHVVKAHILLCSLQTLPLATELRFTGHHLMLTGESG